MIEATPGTRPQAPTAPKRPPAATPAAAPDHRARGTAPLTESLALQRPRASTLTLDQRGPALKEVADRTRDLREARAAADEKRRELAGMLAAYGPGLTPAQREKLETDFRKEHASTFEGEGQAEDALAASVAQHQEVLADALATAPPGVSRAYAPAIALAAAAALATTRHNAAALDVAAAAMARPGVPAAVTRALTEQVVNPGYATQIERTVKDTGDTEDATRRAAADMDARFGAVRSGADGVQQLRTALAQFQMPRGRFDATGGTKALLGQIERLRGLGPLGKALNAATLLTAPAEVLGKLGEGQVAQALQRAAGAGTDLAAFLGSMGRMLGPRTLAIAGTKLPIIGAIAGAAGALEQGLRGQVLAAFSGALLAIGGAAALFSLPFSGTLLAIGTALGLGDTAWQAVQARMQEKAAMAARLTAAGVPPAYAHGLVDGGQARLQAVGRALGLTDPEAITQAAQRHPGLMASGLPAAVLDRARKQMGGQLDVPGLLAGLERAYPDPVQRDAALARVLGWLERGNRGVRHLMVAPAEQMRRRVAQAIAADQRPGDQAPARLLLDALGAEGRSLAG